VTSEVARADSEVDLSQAHRFAVAAAEAAGQLLHQDSLGELTVQQKGLNGDVVTDLDLAAEQLIVGRIRNRFPTHCVVAEEGSGHQRVNTPWTWLVDPLDGTNNLAIGLPAYVVGIALCKYGRPVVGVVHDPITGHTWSAIRDQGALVRGGPGGPAERPLRPVRRPVPAAPVLGWTQGHDVRRDDSIARALKVVLDSTARRVLQLWAPLLCWVMLARGDIDGIIGYRPEAVDLPAGLLIATEAGISVRSLDGVGFDDRFGRSSAQRSFVAGPPETIDRLVRLVTAAKWLAPDLHRLTLVDLASPRW